VLSAARAQRNALADQPQQIGRLAHAIDVVMAANFAQTRMLILRFTKITNTLACHQPRTGPPASLLSRARRDCRSLTSTSQRDGTSADAEAATQIDQLLDVLRRDRP
jgi:hypothetical protein